MNIIKDKNNTYYQSYFSLLLLESIAIDKLLDMTLHFHREINFTIACGSPKS